MRLEDDVTRSTETTIATQRCVVIALCCTNLCLSRFKVYTKTGDGGISSLYNGQRLPKDNGFFQVRDAIDCYIVGFSITGMVTQSGIGAARRDETFTKLQRTLGARLL